MIQASELRVGNWMNHNGRNLQVQTIETLGDGSFAGVLSIGDDYYYRMVHAKDGVLKPIQLTPEILEAAGFAYTASFGECRYTKDNVQMDEHFNPLVQDGNEYLYFGVAIKTVHQLQNLYYSLTGKELEINIPIPA